LPRRADLSGIPHGDLLYAVTQLVAAGKTSPAEVRKLAGDRPARIAALQRELEALRAGVAGNAAPRRGPGRPPGRPPGPRATAPKPKRKFTMTPKARAARKLQGQYLGALRTLLGEARRRVKALAKSKSVAEAVKLARKLKNKTAGSSKAAKQKAAAQAAA
jgi:hypothetical protein